MESNAGKIVKSQNIDEFDLSVNDNSTPATEFSNEKCDGATKNSNPDEIHNLGPNPINISLDSEIEHGNFIKSIKNSLIFQWAGSDSNQRPPPCQGS